jgi:hypothetical protein
MANIFTSMINNFGSWLGAQVAPYINDALGIRGNVLSNYYSGNHRPQLKITAGKQDDNIVQNFVGLAVDRSVSRLFRGGVKWVLPKGAKAQQEYLDKVWELNKKEILLYQVGLHGAIYGTPYFKISPDSVIDPYTLKPYPRLTAIDPETVRIKTSPDDMNDVEQYIIQYKCMEERGGRDVEVSHKEITRHATVDSEPTVGEYNKPETADTWVIEEYEQVGSAPWQLVEQIAWDYNFPPIIHWKNLPSLKSCYGDSDIDDTINIQDKSNFVVSNTGKIIKVYAHPETFIMGISVKQLTDGKLDGSVGSLYAIPDANAKVQNLEMTSDLASSVTFGQNLRQSIFDISREVDLSSMADKLGALTNFGLQVLWSDAIDKNNTKRQLYGAAILELNRRLLMLNNWTGEASNPGSLQWGNPLPVNIAEDMNADKMALDLGIIDKETIANRYFERYGKTWEDIEKAIDAQKEKANQGNADIGSMILQNFRNGKGVATPQQNQQQPPNNQQPNQPQPVGNNQKA